MSKGYGAVQRHVLAWLEEWGAVPLEWFWKNLPREGIPEPSLSRAVSRLAQTGVVGFVNYEERPWPEGEWWERWVKPTTWVYRVKSYHSLVGDFDNVYQQDEDGTWVREPVCCAPLTFGPMALKHHEAETAYRQAERSAENAVNVASR